MSEIKKVRIDEKFIDKRILWRYWWLQTLHEGVIKEISPSGKYVKIGSDWYKIDDIEVVEVLDDERE